MRTLLLGVMVIATAASAGGVAIIVARKRAAEVRVRPDSAHQVSFVRVTRDHDARSKQERPVVVVSKAGQAIPSQAAPGDVPGQNAPAQGGQQGRSGDANDAPVSSANAAAARARLAPGDAAWSMTSASAPGATQGATANGSATQVLSPFGSPAGVGFPASYARTPTWTPTGMNGGTLGGATVAPPFAMTFGR